MDRDERARVVVERAEKFGLRLDLDSGLQIVKRMEPGDLERQDAIVAALGKYLEDVRPLLEKRGIGARANDFIGQRIWSTDGVLASASGDGALEITIVNEGFRHPQTVTACVQDLLIVTNDEEADGTSSPRNDEPKSEQPRKGIFELSRRSSAGSSVERDRS